MDRIKKHLFALMMMALVALSSSAQTIALLADTHISDVENHPYLLRGLAEQVVSTRLFNEDVFAFRAALDDIGRRGVKYVIISGDVTDDGQVVNTLAAKRILEEYEAKYGILFFLTPGNHDPSSPFGKQTFMKGILTPDGGTHVLVSDSSVAVSKHKLEFPKDQVFDELYSLGHEQQAQAYSRFGFFPRKEYLYWATPYTDYGYEAYTFDKAQTESNMNGRMFTYAGGLKAFDTSYVVEPVDGVWLLSIDSGVYLPTGDGKFKNSGTGYNNTLQHKAYLISWIKKVYDEAGRLGKRVVAFSHFPLLDFLDGASDVLARSWGSDKLDIERNPDVKVSQAMFDAGVRLHFAGHMHVLDSEKMTQGGETMYNIQLPSLITGIPAYRLLSLNGRHCHLDIVPVKEVKGFDTFFDQYRKELEYATAHGKKTIWNPQVLSSRSYDEFCRLQFQDLVRNRFAVRDLPKILQKEMLPLTGEELLRKVAPKQKAKKLKCQWTGMDLLTDFYRLHYSGVLAVSCIPTERMEDYNTLFEAIENSRQKSEFMSQMRDFVFAFKCFMNNDNVEDFDI